MRTILSTAGGYNQDEHAYGWTRYLKLMGYAPEATQGAPAPVAAAEEATAKLDNLDGPVITRTTAMLERGNPSALEYILRNGLKAATGAESVGVMKAYTDRVTALREGTDPAREATRGADKAAVKLLVDRNIFPPALEAEVVGLIGIATQLAPAAPAPAPTAENDAEYMKAAEQFHAWLKEWRTTARSVVTRRDYQIMLGVAERRVGAAGDEDDGDDESGPIG